MFTYLSLSLRLPVLSLALSSTSCFISTYFAPQVTLLFITIFLHQMLLLPLVLTFIFTFTTPLVFVHKNEEMESVKSSSRAKIKIPGCSRIEFLKVLFTDIFIYLFSRFHCGLFLCLWTLPLPATKKIHFYSYTKEQKSSSLCLILLISDHLSLGFRLSTLILILILITYCYGFISHIFLAYKQRFFSSLKLISN